MKSSSRSKLDQALQSSELAEQSVIGAILCDPERNIPIAVDKLTADDFFYPLYRHAFLSIVTKHSASQEIDCITLALHMSQEFGEDLVSAQIFLASCPANVTSTSIEHYIGNVLKLSYERINSGKQKNTYIESDSAQCALAKMPSIKCVRDEWYSYDGAAWSRVQKDKFRPVVQSVLKGKDKTSKHVADVLRNIEDSKQIDESTLKGFYSFSDDGYVLINVKNGVLKVKEYDVSLLPHSPDFNFTKVAPSAFTPTETCPVFERVLLESMPDPEDRGLFQLFCGYILLPSSKHETALICYGAGGTGKSTVAEAISASIGGNNIERLTMSQICDPQSYHLPKLQGVALNLGTELDALEVGESGNFKALVSGESINARPIYGKPFIMSSTAKLWFLSNQLPRFKNGSDAELRRCRFIQFDQKPTQKDVELKQKLIAEKDGIFAWMVEGLSSLMGRTEVPIGGKNSRGVHERFAVSNDPIGAFVNSKCLLGASQSIEKESLKISMEAFFEEHAIPHDNPNWLFRKLFDRFPTIQETKSRGSNGRIRKLLGIGLKAEVYA